MLHLDSATLDDTLALGRRLGKLATPGDVITLDGELGAGKTQLVRGLAAGLGLDPTQVSSPTYVLMHEYEPADVERPVLVHIDAYRLPPGTTAEGLASLGYDDELAATAVTAIEWADRLAEVPGVDRLAVTLEHAGATARRITLTPHGRWASCLRDFPV